MSIVGSGLTRLLRPRFELDQSFADREDRGLGPVVDLQLVEDVPHVVLDGLFA